MFFVTNFKLVLRIEKNMDKLVDGQFSWIGKDHHYDKFGYVGKIIPF